MMIGWNHHLVINTKGDEFLLQGNSGP